MQLGNEGKAVSIGVNGYYVYMNLRCLRWCLFAIFFVAVVNSTRHAIQLKDWMLFAPSKQYQMTMRHQLWKALPDASIALLGGVSIWELRSKPHLSFHIVRFCLLVILLIAFINVAEHAQPLGNWYIFAASEDYQNFMWGQFLFVLHFGVIGLLSGLSIWALRGQPVSNEGTT